MGKPICDPEKVLTPCQNRNCDHHFSWGMKSNERVGGKAFGEFTETDASRRSKNCMVLLKEPMGLTEIARMFGVSKQAIAWIETEALKKIRKKHSILPTSAK